MNDFRSPDGTGPSLAFGRGLRGRWDLAPDGVFLNHGSFGAVPKAVTAVYLALRSECEAAPDRFIERRIMPRSEHTELRSVIDRLAAFLGTTDERCALVENVSSGVQAILDSLALERGDMILLTSHQYGAVRLAAERRCATAGGRLKIVDIPIGCDPQEVIERITQAAAGPVRLAIIDHITSATAMLWPVARIVRDLKEKGIPTLVDGAHAIGQIDLDLEGIGAAWYLTNAHKWLYACRGTAVLYADPAAAMQTRPLVASHFVEMGFPRAFDYTGTRDYAAWLALPAAIDFFEALGPNPLRTYMADMIAKAVPYMTAIGARPADDRTNDLAMKTFVLPQRRRAEPEDVPRLQNALWSAARIQIGANIFNGQLLLRVCAQGYVEDTDFAELSRHLGHLGWPARA